MSAARFQPGELVDVHIRGARVSDKHTQDRHLHLFVGEESFSLPVRMLTGARVQRVAPAEWPPQRDDLWRDQHGSKWFTVRNPRGWVEMQAGDPTTDNRYEPATVLEKFGPMTLVFREGWSPAPAADVEAEPEKLDERASFIAGIRELADYVEAHPIVPIDRYTFDAQYFISNHAADEADAYDHLHTIADELGEKPFLPEDPIAAHPLVKKRFSGGVTYEAVIVVSSLRRRAELMAARTPKPEDPTPPGTGDAPAGAPDFDLGPVDVDGDLIAPVVEHGHVSTTAGGPGGCGVECACGVGFYNFDTVTEAQELLNEHIANPDPRDATDPFRSVARRILANAEEPESTSGLST